ncbi:MAG: hypothetical protein ACOX2Z_01440 [Minisyncoccales bacterium]
MKKKLLYAIILIAIIAGIVVFCNQREVSEPNRSDYKSIVYRINDVEVKLEDGYAEESIPNSASKIITSYFGNELVTDLNGDGLDDVVFYITQQTGGTGTFYYIVAALNSEDGYIGSNGYFIGDRIAPQAIEEIGEGIVVVNYAERGEDEPMTEEPSIGKSIFLKLNDDNELVLIESHRSHPAARDLEE